jgi:hypothetical protein
MGLRFFYGINHISSLSLFLILGLGRLCRLNLTHNNTESGFSKPGINIFDFFYVFRDKTSIPVK